MAWSRLEKIGTIFSRVNGLIRAGALKEEDRPLWFDIYKRFPPIDEPRFDRPAKEVTVRKIFYPEDVERAKFHQLYGSSYRTNLADNRSNSTSQEFLKIYSSLKESGEFKEEELFEKAVNRLGIKTFSRQGPENFDTSAKQLERRSSLASSFRKAKEKSSTDLPHSEVNIKNIFKE
ncbi:hypothetical protein J437_LFUL010234 [Ladona fulva]|uniref:Small ribosomal subunit protein mS23 n=1 Tax=Ladona fulva TaxID=123851 RepID=A0A8K0K9G3_LADFU|nr:hypothetical protein J437_LFUL010234 [Ladona fulva]